METIAPRFGEAIRLVIWDLDETFWRGTLTEGGATPIPEHAEIVRELSRRGIISSVCSKNDLSPVRDLLEAQGIWDYFVFADVSWASKGGRVKAMVERMGLRAPTVLFIDDNPSNLNEVRAAVPGINTASETMIPLLLAHDQLRGKDDHGLSRLKQYRQLEQRAAAMAQDPAGADAFLRQSNIRVELVYDLEGHFDRIIELINRTNQLNFTKIRLSEDMEFARDEVRALTSTYLYQCALVKVRDDYGDHGFCGFYAYMAEARHLLHFCFSCRILGMGVEQWIYDKLQRPSLVVQGEVISNLEESSRVDWINTGAGESFNATSKTPVTITARGGCDLSAIMHYFATIAHGVRGEFHYFRDGLPVRMDHTAVTVLALDPPKSGARARAARLLDFQDEDFDTHIFDNDVDDHAVILGLSADAMFPLFRHRETELTLPAFLPHVAWANGIATIGDELHSTQREATEKRVRRLEADFDYLGLIEKDDFSRNISTILHRITKTTRVYIPTIYEGDVVTREGAVYPAPCRNARMNAWLREAIQGHPNVELIDLNAVVEAGDAIDHYHFNRMVYFRMFEALYASIGREGAAMQPSPANDTSAPRRGLERLPELRTGQGPIGRLLGGLLRLSQVEGLPWRRASTRSSSSRE